MCLEVTQAMAAAVGVSKTKGSVVKMFLNHFKKFELYTPLTRDPTVKSINILFLASSFLFLD